MKIRMLHSALGSENGYHVWRYEAGQEYDVGESLAAQFLRREQAVRIVDDEPEDKLLKA